MKKQAAKLGVFISTIQNIASLTHSTIEHKRNENFSGLIHAALKAPNPEIPAAIPNCSLPQWFKL